MEPRSEITPSALLALLRWIESAGNRGVARRRMDGGALLERQMGLDKDADMIVRVQN
ncbi:MAG TPA: hypothetical protein VE957_20895 [Terriglobales bacterium]|nr:hypothetical protein [Terriglobales bacterium]